MGILRQTLIFLMKPALQDIHRTFIEIAGDNGLRVGQIFFEIFDFLDEHRVGLTFGKLPGTEIAHAQSLKLFFRFQFQAFTEDFKVA